MSEYDKTKVINIRVSEVDLEDIKLAQDHMNENAQYASYNRSQTLLRAVDFYQRENNCEQPL